MFEFTKQLRHSAYIFLRLESTVIWFITKKKKEKLVNDVVLILLNKIWQKKKAF